MVVRSFLEGTLSASFFVRLRYRHTACVLLTLAFFTGIAILVPASVSATAGVNQQMSFEGKIVSSTGQNITDGTYNMEFKIYTAAGACNPTTGSGCTLGWTEDWLVSGSNGVTFRSGTYQANLDSVAANNFAGIDFNSYPLYLSLQIGNTSVCAPAGNFQTNCGGDGEMKPYILLTSTPYAQNANMLNGLSSAAFGQLAVAQTWTNSNTFQPTTDVTPLIVKQNSVASPTADIFTIQTANGTNVMQVTGPSANNAAVVIGSAGVNAVTITSGAALTLTGTSASVWSTTTGTLTVESASGSSFTASAQGSGQSNFGSVGTGVTVVGNSTGNTQLTGPTYTSSTSGVLIGSGIVASPILLQLSNATVASSPAAATPENTANCTTTVNAGALYYSAATTASSTTSNELRGCINGKWADIVTGDQLGIILFGVVEDSGVGTGDISGITGYTNSPCKVTWASTTSVTVAPCTAYSAGRKVVVTSPVTISGLGSAGSVNYQHICLSGVNTNEPAKTAVNATETANVPAFSLSAPVLCLATIKTNVTPAITNIYDTRVFVTSTKEYVTSSTPVAPGMIVVNDATGANRVKAVSTATTVGVRGVVAVGTTTGSGSVINSIIAISGPAFVKGTGVITSGQTAKTSTTLGYAQSTAISTGYTQLGMIFDVGSTAACGASSNCQFSVLVDVFPN